MFLTLYYLLALILILTIHEFSHAWMALRLGDPTAERAGRLSLNPLHHLDLLGTLMLFFVGIGWGKPVPVDVRNFKNPIRDEAMTAFAGPLANLALAFLAAIPYSYLPQTGAWDGLILFSEAVLDLSLILFVFNLLPFPPLDGSKFLMIFVPRQLRPAYFVFLQRATPYFLAFLIVDLYILSKIFGAPLIWTVISTATFWLRTAILVVV